MYMYIKHVHVHVYVHVSPFFLIPIAGLINLKNIALLTVSSPSSSSLPTTTYKAKVS